MRRRINAQLRCATTFAVVFCAISQLTTLAQERQWLSYEPATVELEGRLTVQWKYGPPNFGENPKTDKRVKVPIIVLAKAINVRGTPGAAHNAVSVQGARRIQLVFTDPAMDYKSLAGKDIVVKGSLFHAETGGHYTDVVMSVQSIEPKRRRALAGTGY